MSNIRHMFPGNNTGQGFFSYFAYLLPQAQAQRVYCLKGGPGVGKSTFLKRIGERMAQEGFALEYMHCASDPDSLDGLVIPALGVALIDGTAPHVIDPAYPAAVDEIVNLGEFWDAAAIRENRGEIVRINGEIKGQYRRAFQYLAAAKCLMDDVVETFEAATDKSGIGGGAGQRPAGRHPPPVCHRRHAFRRRELSGIPARRRRQGILHQEPVGRGRARAAGTGGGRGNAPRAGRGAVLLPLGARNAHRTPADPGAEAGVLLGGPQP